jgi:hypothetical protein
MSHLRNLHGLEGEHSWLLASVIWSWKSLYFSFAFFGVFKEARVSDDIHPESVKKLYKASLVYLGIQPK